MSPDGSSIGMDCSVVRSKKHPDLLLVSTTDFFYPLVEDPYLQGKIAAANVLSDMYALGVVDVDNVLMLLAASSDMPKDTRDIVTKLIMRGFADACREADSDVTGGQSVVNPWPIIGGVAQSVCKTEDYIDPVDAQVGDVIVLTKPLGTQIAVNLKQWMGNEAQWSARAEGLISKEEAQSAYLFAQASMVRLNRNAAKLMHKYGAKGATDVTGFGIVGHLNNLAKNQKREVQLQVHTLPIIAGMAAVVKQKHSYFKLLEGFSAETSGGLLVILPASAADSFCKELQDLDGVAAYIVGDVVPAKDGVRQGVLTADVGIIEVDTSSF